MKTLLHLDILAQPDDTTCGPTCLQAVYAYYGDTIPLDQVIREVTPLSEGGTLAVLLGCHALKRNYRATLYTFDLQVFDPTWFKPGSTDLIDRLRQQLKAKNDPKLGIATMAYIDFLQSGGTIRFQDLTAGLIRKHLKQDQPILTGLSATYLYKTAREVQEGDMLRYDDLKGEPSGHFVVLCGYLGETKQAVLADPLLPNPICDEHIYEVGLNHLVCSIMLGTLTFDANLLVIAPR